MKVITLSCLIFIFFASSALAQKNNYKNYYELTIQAREQYDQGNCKSALKLSKAAFKLVELPLWRDYQKVVEIGICLKDTLLIKKYCKKMAEEYGLLPAATKFRDTLFYLSLQNEFETELTRAVAGFDQEYIVVIDSLFKEDITFRKDGRAIYVDNINSDSVRMHTLLKWINERGFPEQRKVGMKGYYNAMLIFIHADFDINNELLGDLMLENVMNGKMNPADYARIIDRRCNYRGTPFIYYQAPLGYDNLSDEEKEKVRLLRRGIGLRDVHESMTIQILPNGDKQSTSKY